MATKKKEEIKEETEDVEDVLTDDRVEVFIPRAGANEDPNFFVSVNGVNYLLPRGKKSKVPAHIAYEIERARKAEEDAAQVAEEMLEASR